MSPGRQRTAIAEARGLEVLRKPNPDDPDAWNRGYFTPSAARQRYKNWPNCGAVKIIPDYLNDLNAMHEAEKVLTPEQQIQYAAKLWKLLDAHGWGEERGWWIMLHATAAQRVEAFLRTIGKWEGQE